MLIPEPTEQQITRQIIDAINKLPGIWAWRNNTGRKGDVQFGITGQADITGIVNGKRLEIEVKKPGQERTLSESQRAFLDRVGSLGGVSGVVTSLDQALKLVEPALLSKPTE